MEVIILRFELKT